MVPLFLAIVVVIVFSILLSVLGGVKKSIEVIQVCQDSIRLVRNKNLDDDAKEKALQENSKKLFLSFLFIAFASTAAILIPIGGLWGLDKIGFVSFVSVIGILESWEFISGITLTFIILAFLKKKFS